MCIRDRPVTVTINPVPVLQITNPPAVCAPGTVDLTASAVTAGSTLQGGALSYWTDAAGTVALSNPSAVAASGTYYMIGPPTTSPPGSETEPANVTNKPMPALPITNPPAV